MNDPPRLLDPKSGAPISRSLLRAGVDMGPPPGAKEQVWSSVSNALGGALVVGSVGSKAAVSVKAAASIKAAASAVDAASSAGSSAAGSSGGAALNAGGAAKLTGLKLIAGKWILLSSLSLVVAGGTAYRVVSGPSSSSSSHAVPVSAKDLSATGKHGSRRALHPGNADSMTPAESGDSASDSQTNGAEGDVTADDVTAENVPAENVAQPSMASGNAADTAHEPVSGADASSAKSSRTDARLSSLANAAPSGNSVAGTSRPGSVKESDRSAKLDVKDPPTDPVAEVDTEPAKPKSGTSIDAAPDGSSRLLAESAALVDSRMELQSGNAAGAIQALQKMDKRFGGGGLSQERAALLVQALAANGQRDEAKRQADAFLAAYPSSPLAARVRPFASH